MDFLTKLILPLSLVIFSLIHEASSIIGCRLQGMRVTPGYVVLQKCVAERYGTVVVMKACGLYGEVRYYIFNVHEFMELDDVHIIR